MTASDTYKSQIAYARLAGFMYLFVIAADILGMVLASRPDGAGALHRIGLSSQLIGSLCTVLLAMGLYVAVKPIDNNLALLALVFRLVEAAGGLQLVSAFDESQLPAHATVHSAVHSAAPYVPALFFSAGSTIFFYLFLKSTYIPKVLSVLGLVGSVLFAIVSFGCLIWPEHAAMLQPGWIPMAVAEISVGLWLLVKGVNVQPRDN
jgi:hypothetical protein